MVRALQRFGDFFSLLAVAVHIAALLVSPPYASMQLLYFQLRQNAFLSMNSSYELHKMLIQYM